MDGVVSLHTIYHVPREEQAAAILELYRVLALGRTGVIVSSWTHTWLVRALKLPPYLWSRMRQQRTKSAEKPGPSPDAPLFFEPHLYTWFAAQLWPFAYDILSWRSLSVSAMRFYAPDNGAGRLLLRIVSRIEDRFPHLSGRYGQYPLIVFRK